MNNFKKAITDGVTNALVSLGLVAKNEKGEETNVSDLRMIFSESVRKFLVEDVSYPLNLEGAKNAIVSAIIRHEDDMIESINYFIEKGADPKKITNNMIWLQFIGH